MGYQEGVLHRIKTHHPDPIGYLWEDLGDGSLQHGNGGFQPTLAVGRSISKAEYDGIIDYINSYEFEKYRLTDHQCTSFVVGVLAHAGLEVDANCRIGIQQYQSVLGRRIKLWTDPAFGEIVLPLPQVLEEKLAQGVAGGQLFDATEGYPELVAVGEREGISDSIDLVLSTDVGG
jgi:hypothetical protein